MTQVMSGYGLGQIASTPAVRATRNGDARLSNVYPPLKNRHTRSRRAHVLVAMTILRTPQGMASKTRP
jgi:hypothetical protein